MNLVLSTLLELCGLHDYSPAFAEECFNLKQEQHQICLQNIERGKFQRDVTRKLIMNQLVNSP